MSWNRDRLPELVRAMAGRPRHEALRGQVTELLRSGFSAPYDEISHEVYLLDGSGRIDTMWGATVIELKSDLRRELDDVLARLPVYLADAAARSRSPRPVTGLATDGATFIAYTLRGGALQELARYATDPERPSELMAWLEPLLSNRPDLLPEPRAVAQAFGRASLTFGRARLALDALWAALRDDPEVRLKRDLWDGLLREAYGEAVGEDSLFLQHIPDDIGRLRKLETLYASRAPITTVSARIGSLDHLRTLWLQHVALSAFPDAILDCTALETLSCVQPTIGATNI